VRKEDFLATFQTAFLATFTTMNIQAGFSGSGIYPFNLEAVLLELDPLPRSPSPTLSQRSWNA